MKEEYIIVNATALDRSGALSILRQFVENIPADSAQRWLVFVSDAIEIRSENPQVRIEAISGVKSLHRRLWWDTVGVTKWLKKNRITPVAAVSLQNTGFRVGRRVKQFIYYHQPLPFFPYQWNPLKKEQRTLWFYKKIYPFFVNLFLQKDTTVFVQLDFIKSGFIKRFKHPTNQIEVYSPSVNKAETSDCTTDQHSDSVNLFFPAASHFYKNHSVLYRAMDLTQRKVNLFVTLPDFKEAVTGVSSVGIIPYAEVCEMYQRCDALAFPSYIETFGLPLLEAALTGMPILAADLPYAREVLKGYGGATFIPHDDPQAWADAIDNLSKGKRFPPIDISNRPGWTQLFQSLLAKL